MVARRSFSRRPECRLPKVPQETPLQELPLLAKFRNGSSEQELLEGEAGQVTTAAASTLDFAPGHLFLDRQRAPWRSPVPPHPAGNERHGGTEEKNVARRGEEVNCDKISSIRLVSQKLLYVVSSGIYSKI